MIMFEAPRLYLNILLSSCRKIMMDFPPGRKDLLGSIVGPAMGGSGSSGFVLRVIINLFVVVLFVRQGGTTVDYKSKNLSS
ncbi:hypothetical protein Avbf_08359 [Armadillidium vulgare]|nr:hypothetical protein Avbf_08359 [Armadillidium vulgare]